MTDQKDAEKEAGDRIAAILEDGGVEKGEQQEGTSTILVAPLKNGGARPDDK